MNGPRMGLSMGLRQTLRQEPRIMLKQIIDFEHAYIQIDNFFEENKGEFIPLRELLRLVPQRQYSQIVYAVAGGWAVEVLTGRKRQHSNINVIMFDPERRRLNSDRCLDYLFLNYGNGLKKNQVMRREWKPAERNVYVSGPEFLIATKVAPCNGKSPREKDLCDVIYLMESQPELNPVKLRTAFGNYPQLRHRGEYVRQIMQMHDAMQGNGSRVKKRYALDILAKTIADNIRENTHKNDLQG